MKIDTFKKIALLAASALILLTASCAAPAGPGPTVTPVYVTAPPTAAPTAVPTTPPDASPTPEPDPSPTAKPAPTALVPAGIVKNSGEIIGSDVAFREGPGTDTAVLGRLDRGTFVQIVKTNVNAQWHEVKYDGKTGYVNRMYICLDSSMDGYKLDFVGRIINCNNDVNVRKEPTTDSEIIGVAKKGTTLNILPQETYVKDWYQVEFEGQTAYIHADYLDVTAKADDTQLSELSVSGGTLYPYFSPNEYGYVVKATASEVTIKAKANSGVKISMNGYEGSAFKIAIPSAGMKTVRVALDGEIRYSVYISRNVLTIGTWNIKRGDGHLLMQGRLVYDQQPDMMGIQEAFQNLKAANIIDNLASLKTKDMSHNVLSPTINYSGGGEYGIGMISRYKLGGIKTYTLDSGGHEKRILQKAVVEIDGKTVSFYNTHFSYNSASVRKKQFEKVLEVMNADKNEYKILVGDFNAGISEFSVFKKYTVVNTDETKYYDYSRNPIDYSEIDNVVVSKNIKVINTRLIVNSFSDHYPVFAYLILD